MQAFKAYILQEFGRTDYAASEFKYTYTTNTKMDKSSMRPLVHNSINVKVNIVDKDMQVLDSKSFKFVDNELTKANEKKLINIAPAELDNRFVAALPEIAGIIGGDISGRISDLHDQLSSLNAYTHHNNTVIPDAFRGKSVVIGSTEEPSKKTTKFEF